MRKLVWLTRCLTLASIGLADSTVFSQSNSTPYRPTGGWNSSQAVAPSNNNATPANNSAVVQSAFYQAGNPEGFPGFPSDAYSQGNPQSGMPGVVLPQNMPSMPNALNAGSMSDAQNYLPQQSNVPQLNQQSNQQFNQPAAASPQYNPSTYDPSPYGQAQSFPQPSVFPQQGNPQQNYAQPSRPPFQTAAAGNDLRAVESNATNAGNQLRATNPALQSGFGPNTQSQPIATGLPYVTPAPRTGRFPTSPYNSGQFQTVSYQTTSQPTVNTLNSQQVFNTASIANTQPVLPPNQSAAVYPTAYQQCQPGLAPTSPPLTTPPYVAPVTGTYSPNNSGYSPLISLGQEKNNVMIGRGIIGQPTVYVPRQPVRNFLRYIFP